jgi:putative membrane protein
VKALVTALVVFVALEHVWFLVLEMFLWTRPIGLKIFRNTPESAQRSAMLAANQGLYNGFLAAGLLWGAFHPDRAVGVQVEMFFLACVALAGLYGGYSVSRRVFLLQGLPALVALVLLWLGRA